MPHVNFERRASARALELRLGVRWDHRDVGLLGLDPFHLTGQQAGHDLEENRNERS